MMHTWTKVMLLMLMVIMLIPMIMMIILLMSMITTMIFDGPQNINEINRGLVKLLKKDGFNSIGEAVGSRNPLL